ncbi:hypothetical protein FPZ54_01980 [Sphingomonas suaedae]|uniref:Uncharacterized protein n=1 Tax=Sphingomonas suaedae TaxID=2599297 RepID=A0A518RBU6_9SPHN|nr:hypothetical protein [Sphingomonas suaedae]QDX24918.1 hypothetical protein FPZ54_01980 [Sphingomonas suaedae]
MRERGGSGIDAAADAPMLRQRAEEERRHAIRAASARVRIVRAEMAGHYDAAASLLEGSERKPARSRLHRLLTWASRTLRAKKRRHDPFHRQ